MKSDVQTFRDHFDDLVEDAARFMFFVRDKERQSECIHRLEALLKECTEQKETEIENEDEDSANAYLAFEYMARAQIAELEFYLALKQDLPGVAWDHLINAEMCLAQAMQAHDVASHLVPYIERLRMLETAYFPRMAFMSTAYVVRRSECNICGEDYGVCDHLKGKPYMGKLCARIVAEAEVRGVSIVSDPADRLCRVTSFSDGGKVWIDSLTWRVVEETEAPASVPHPTDPGEARA